MVDGEKAYDVGTNIHAERLFCAFKHIHQGKLAQLGIWRLPIGRRQCQEGHASRQNGSSGWFSVPLHRLIDVPSHGRRNWVHAHANACAHAHIVHTRVCRCAHYCAHVHS